MASGRRRYKVNLDELIDLIRQYPFLYDPRDASYKDNVMRENWWQAIADRFNTPVNVIQKKWKSLKDRYIRERRVYYTKKKLYENKAYISPPKWRLYAVIENFLENTLQLRKPRYQLNYDEDWVKNISSAERGDTSKSTEADGSNSQLSLQISTWASISNESDNPHNSPAASRSESPTIIISSPTTFKIEPDSSPNSNSDQVAPVVPDSITITPIPAMHMQQPNVEVDDQHKISEEDKIEDEDQVLVMNEVLLSIESTLSNLNTKINSHQFSHSEDEVHYYAMSLAQRLRNLSDKNRHAFKMKVEEILYGLEQTQK